MKTSDTWFIQFHMLYFKEGYYAKKRREQMALS